MLFEDSIWAANAKNKAKAAAVAQSVEHILGKDEVIGSIPICSSTDKT